MAFSMLMIHLEEFNDKEWWEQRKKKESENNTHFK